MDDVGKMIKSRRRHLGLSRLQLAQSLGVSSQTVLNFETDPTYNLGTNLLRRLEEALHVIISINMDEGRTMNTRIKMGNDEFILYIRKNHEACITSNDRLGRLIWEWIVGRDKNAIQLNEGKSVPCFWADQGAHIGEIKLPKTATQFELERNLLPALYEYLDALGSI